ncbi:MAG: DUF167 domain-containing protein [Anaerolineales bacterium]|nr:DUF167 domain-containing protein [Anaerolineales bacterium]
MKKKFNLHDGKHGAALTVRVTPRARRTEIADISENGTLRIRVAGLTRDGEANTILLEFLAGVLEIQNNRLDIVAGENGLDKIISVLDMSSTEAEGLIEKWIDSHEPTG